MKKTNLAKILFLAAAVGGFALSASAQVHWINGATPFTSTNLGEIPDGWTISGTRGPAVTDDTFVVNGNNSVHVPGGGVGIYRPGTFDTAGELNWYFYDDMADDATNGKNIRVGLMRPADGDAGAPRFGAIAVERSVSETNYVAHIGFGFTPTTVVRTEGWRQMTLAWSVVADATQVEFYVDGILGHTASHSAIITPTNEWIGAPFASDTGAWVNTIPEPSTYAAIFGGLALLGAFVYRRRLRAKK